MTLPGPHGKSQKIDFFAPWPGPMGAGPMGSWSGHEGPRAHGPLGLFYERAVALVIPACGAIYHGCRQFIP